MREIRWDGGKSKNKPETSTVWYITACWFWKECRKYLLVEQKENFHFLFVCIIILFVILFCSVFVCLFLFKSLILLATSCTRNFSTFKYSHMICINVYSNTLIKTADPRRIYSHSVIVLTLFRIKMYLLGIIHVCYTCVSCLCENEKFTWNDRLSLNIIQFSIQAIGLATRLYRSCTLARPDIYEYLLAVAESGS